MKTFNISNFSQLIAGCILSMSLASVASAAKIYVQAGADMLSADGTKKHPYGSLQQVQDHSKEGDTISILPSTMVLDGGIILKNNQTLVGNSTINCYNAGKFNPTHCSSDSGGTTITNTTPGNIFDFNPLSGAGIVLAKNNTITRVSLKMTNSSAIIGFDPGKVTVRNVLIKGGNQDKKLDATYTRLIPATPVASGIYIRFTASSAVNTEVSIKDIVLQSASSCPMTASGATGCNFGWGIAVIGDGEAMVDVKKGILTDMRNNPLSTQTAPPILLLTSGNGSLAAQVDSITTFGGIDNDGIDIWAEDASKMTVGLNKYYYVGSQLNNTTDAFREAGLEVLAHLSFLLTGFPPVFPEIKPEINVSVHNSYFAHDELGTVMFLRNTAKIDMSGNAFTDSSIFPMTILSYEPEVFVNAKNSYWDDDILVPDSGNKLILNPAFINACLISNYNFATGVCTNPADSGSVIFTAPAKPISSLHLNDE